MKTKTKTVGAFWKYQENTVNTIRQGQNVIGKDTGVWFDSFLIDKGSGDGLGNNIWRLSMQEVLSAG